MCRGEAPLSLLWAPLGQMRSVAPMGGRLEHCVVIPRVQGCLLLPQTGRGGPTILGNDKRRIGIPTGPSFPLQQSTRSVPSPRYLSAQTQASSAAQSRTLSFLPFLPFQIHLLTLSVHARPRNTYPFLLHPVTFQSLRTVQQADPFTFSLPRTRSPIEVLPLFARACPIVPPPATWRSTSSVYSATLAHPGYYGPAAGDVSPPSSPDGVYADNR